MRSRKFYQKSRVPLAPPASPVSLTSPNLLQHPSPTSPSLLHCPSALLPAPWLGTYSPPHLDLVSALDPAEDSVYERNPLPWEPHPHSRNADKAGTYILNLAVRIPFTSHSEHVRLRRADRCWVRGAGEFTATAPTHDPVLAQRIFADGSCYPRSRGWLPRAEACSANVSRGSQGHPCPPLPTWNSILFCIQDRKCYRTGCIELQLPCGPSKGRTVPSCHISGEEVAPGEQPQLT